MSAFGAGGFVENGWGNAAMIWDLTVSLRIGGVHERMGVSGGILLAILIPEKTYAAETVPQLDWQKEIDLAETDEIFKKNAGDHRFL